MRIKHNPQQAVGHVATKYGVLAVASLILAFNQFLACAGRQSRNVAVSESVIRKSEKVMVEAYLFDVVVKRDGKSTSLRLDVFDSDSVIALGGRAYLGKGALRGKITRDSVAAYFPTSDEFIAQNWSSFSISGDSPRNLTDIGLEGLLKYPPDTGMYSDSIRVDATLFTSGEIEMYICRGGLNSELARWGIALKYVMTEGDLRLGRFEFHSRELEIKGVRREYRSRARVSLDRFQVTIPATATSVSP